MSGLYVVRVTEHANWGSTAVLETFPATEAILAPLYQWWRDEAEDNHGTGRHLEVEMISLPWNSSRASQYRNRMEQALHDVEVADG